MGRQEPARARVDPGVLAHQPHPQLGQDLRQHRCFRDLEQETNDALALFGNKDAKGIVLLKPYAEYYAEYAEQGRRTAASVSRSASRSSAKRRRRRSSSCSAQSCGCKNILTAFDDFAGKEILSAREFQDYQSVYLTCTPSSASSTEAEKESINDDVVFEIELIKQVEINVDYILMLVEKYLKAQERAARTRKSVPRSSARSTPAPACATRRTSSSSSSIPSPPRRGSMTQWQAFVAAKRKAEELERIIAEENLDAEATRAFVDNAFRDGAIPTTGTAITTILPPVSRFAKNSNAIRSRSRRCWTSWQRSSSAILVLCDLV